MTQCLAEDEEGFSAFVLLDHMDWLAESPRLLEDEWHVLHFIGHGGYDTDTDEGVLAFVGRNGRADLVPASRLAGTHSDQGRIRWLDPDQSPADRHGG